MQGSAKCSNVLSDLGVKCNSLVLDVQLVFEPAFADDVGADEHTAGATTASAATDGGAQGKTGNLLSSSSRSQRLHASTPHTRAALFLEPFHIESHERVALDIYHNTMRIWALRPA
eukprot:1028668-Pleurochrysis_carterae.AAC.1